MGVRAIDVSDDDQVVGMVVTEEDRKHVLAVCAKGYGKRTDIEEFRVQNRGGKGIILIDASDRNGPVVDIRLVKDGDEIMLITDKGVLVRTRVAEIRELGRATQGVTLIGLDEGSRLSGLQRIVENDANAAEADASSDLPDEAGAGGEATEG